MLESLKTYFGRNSYQGVAQSFYQEVVNTATTGEELRNATLFVVGSNFEDVFGEIVRNKIFEHAKQLVEGAENANLKPLAEAGALGEALEILDRHSRA